MSPQHLHVVSEDTLRKLWVTMHAYAVWQLRALQEYNSVR